MKKFWVLVLSVLLILSLASCSSTPSSGTTKGTTAASTTGATKPASISIISTTDDVALLEYVGNIYEQKYGVKLEIISQAYDNTHQKITTSISGNTGIDLAYVDVIWPAEFGSLGITIPLDSFMTDTFKADLISSSLSQMQYQGKTYAIPFANNGKWMFYNKKMLADAGYTEAPKTWAALKTVSQDLISKGVAKYGIAWAAKQAEGVICDMTTMIYAFGGTWQDAKGAFNFNSDAAVNAMNFVYGSIKDGWADPSSVSYGDRETLDPFMAGDTPFVMNWSFAWGLTNDPTQSKVAGNVGICLIPGSDNVKSSSVTGGGGFGILSSSDSQDYAWKFIETLVSADVQKYALKNGATLPTLKSVYEDKDMQKQYDFLSLMYPQYEFAHFRPQTAKYSEWSNIAQVAISSVLVGKATAKDAFDKAVSDSNAIK
jgi:multiple sugar transport system substrate-binding protein